MKTILSIVFIVGAALMMSFTEPEVTKHEANVETVSQPLSSVFVISSLEVRNQIVKAQIAGADFCWECTPSVFGGCTRVCLNNWGQMYTESCGCPKKPQT